MNKSIFYIALSVLLLVFFSCDLPTPSAIEIRGNPEIAFPANIDIVKIISEALAEGAEGAHNFTLINCNNTFIQTYMAYMDLFDDDGGEMTVPNLPIIGTVPSEGVNLFNESQLPYILIPLSSFNDYLTGFTLSGVKFIVFTSSNKPELLDLLSIEVIVDGTPIAPIGNFPSKKSSIANWTNGYNGNDAPIGSKTIDLPLVCNDTTVKFRVFIEGGKTITDPDIFNNAKLSVEVVFWLPLVFEADAGGGELTFPDDVFSNGDDLFGREDADSENKMSDFIESLELNFRFNYPVFSGANLIVTSQNITIVNKATGNSLGFSIDEATMADINKPENYPFIPKLKIEIDPGRTLVFPNGLKAKELAFKAKIRHRIDL